MPNRSWPWGPSAPAKLTEAELDLAIMRKSLPYRITPAVEAYLRARWWRRWLEKWKARRAHPGTC